MRVNEENFGVLQKEQILLGREHGLSERQIRRYAKQKYNFQEMEQIRCELENKKENSRSHAGILAAGIAAVILTGYFAAEWINASQRPYLELTQETVTVREGTAFDPTEYVKGYSDRGGKLLLPSVSLQKEGTYIAPYRLMSGDPEILRTLIVHVEKENRSDEERIVTD